MNENECIEILSEMKRQSNVILENPTTFYSQKYILAGCETMKNHILAYDIAIKALKEIQQYRVIGAVEECQEAREKQRAKKPIYKHYEDKGESPYIKISCPNRCGIRLYPVTEKHLAHEHVFCPKCGQKLDWSDTD